MSGKDSERAKERERMESIPLDQLDGDEVDKYEDNVIVFYATKCAIQLCGIVQLKV